MALAGAAAMPGLWALLLPFLAVATCLDVPSRGCYWTGCQSKWFGVCAARHFLDSQSDDCDGLCVESKSHPCLPLHTHFYCCKPGIPKVTNKCGHCKSKLDFGKEFICCSDCSDPTVMDKNSKLGYCKSGADLTMQIKPEETFHWVAGPWMTCSSPCDGGYRYRDVACYGNLDDNTIKHYPVDDANCSANEMPARQEACNQQSCSDSEMTQSVNPKKSGMSGWLVALVVILGLSAAAGIAFTSYTYYVRRTSGTSGFVYVMMEAYS
ncbi:thrombospondin type-1 domain-containing protein 4 [Sorghum bicolor]|uniref:Uncharacterized protein n=2 Tax=Sorghum bicolor TaxID=4558 RepID=C5XQZ0_SORBI|nr:thrombospondin type-1 domain-containing protein 4 [Sorghum bicolor]EES03266.1 hypothetical protein SORBI_3003G217500 [Sorghum bicolor]|eukprot:XP_002458146.1 thrombospondin type-1 domain-containing protein 4 [Sorghum bicolor]